MTQTSLNRKQGQTTSGTRKTAELLGEELGDHTVALSIHLRTVSVCCPQPHSGQEEAESQLGLELS